MTAIWKYITSRKLKLIWCLVWGSYNHQIKFHIGHIVTPIPQIKRNHWLVIISFSVFVLLVFKFVKYSNVWHENILYTYLTGFTKRGLPHTSNFMHLKDCNFLLVCGMNLKFSHNVLLCFSLLLTMKSYKLLNVEIGCVWKAPFRKPSFYHDMIIITVYNPSSTEVLIKNVQHNTMAN